MNRHSTAEVDVGMAIQHEAVKRIRSAFDKICEEYETKLNRKPTNEEIVSNMEYRPPRNSFFCHVF